MTQQHAVMVGGEGERSLEERSGKQGVADFLLLPVLLAATANTVAVKAGQVDGGGRRAWTTQQNTWPQP